MFKLTMVSASVFLIIIFLLTIPSKAQLNPPAVTPNPPSYTPYHTTSTGSSSSSTEGSETGTSNPQPFTPYDRYKLIHWNHGPPLPIGVETSAGCIVCNTSLHFSNPASEKFKVGKAIPGLPFITKHSWAGNIPIQGPGVRNASLFFWMWGMDSLEMGNDTIIWLNGGPSCSSLIGMVQENGPFIHRDERKRPTVNDYSWTKVANMLYVEQPIGIGFTTGEDLDTTELQVAIQFESFLTHFFEIFPEIKKTNIWFAAESYGGVYISYIMDHLYNKAKYPQIKGGLIIDGVIPPQSLEQAVAYQYSLQHKAEFNFTHQDLSDIKNEADACNLTNYVDQNLVYPSKGDLDDVSEDCEPWSLMNHFARERNPNYTPYNIAKKYEDDYNPLGEVNTGNAVYHHQNFFDNRDLQKYIHAPDQKWVLCTATFYRGDESDYPIYYPNPDHSILAGVIERSEKFIIMNGILDALIIANATAMALQNLTWAKHQGFTNKPSTPLWDIDGNRTGVVSEERGLTFAIVSAAGHAIPQDAPATGFAAVMHLLGKRDWSKKPNYKVKSMAKARLF